MPHIFLMKFVRMRLVPFLYITLLSSVNPYTYKAIFFHTSDTIYFIVGFSNTGELGYDGLRWTRRIGSSYAYDRLSLSYVSVYVIALGTSFDIYIKVKTVKEYAWLDFYYTCICLLRNTRKWTQLRTCVSLGGNKLTARYVFVRHTQC